ncbi:S16 family serine protease [Candidatus Nitrosotenuis chungbukensis]|uniref:S16 family serine protease n=1 Tax=Candidatus Nitrosotenuis chungbukensis TaxID=1353246 RepID=UPI0006950644|nr:S16 family serine protease [Candidatus Nitrosotenuis chungbukensis]WKT58100.1 S16 family serine protease [Candidatus Nitrosotenuis chungbukensis]
MSKVTIILGIILAVSLYGNYTLYQDTHTLRQDVSDLDSQVRSFQRQADEIQKKMGAITSARESLEEAQSQLEKTINVLDSSKSITAVAVRPILSSDGFFQNVEYQGTVMSITVDIRDGTGLVLVNTAIPTGVDFQTSAKTAVSVAQKYTNADLSEKDIIFSITAKNNEELQAVDGQSAGMAMTVLLVMEIQNKPINDKVLLTGTIQPDGTIGPVGGVAEKADAAGKYGAETFIVPKGQAIVMVQECEESQQGPFIYKSCKSEAKPLSPVTEEKYGMTVAEATDLASVLGYFE